VDGSDSGAARTDRGDFAAGATFWKLSGSGNDFVAFDRMAAAPDAPLPSPGVIRALCRRGLGVGADGVVVLRRAEGLDYELVYYNADGSRAELCGNASLCSVRLAVELGYAAPGAVRFRTDAGVMTGRIADGLPEIDLAAPAELATDRRDLLAPGDPPGDRIGFARVGVPHVVIRCADTAAVDLELAAPHFRHHPALADGANVNFASRSADGTVSLRTFERGVEAETLACGTGSVATALLLAAWSPGGSAAGATETQIVTRSGLRHRVRTRGDAAGRPEQVSLAGTARIVYRATLGEGDWG
jgi:diaminopimelate epimerase